MSARANLTGQAVFGRGICEVHIRALNELLAPGRDPLNLEAFRALSFAAHMDALGEEANGIFQPNPAARACEPVDQRLLELVADLRKGESEVKRLTRYLRRRVREIGMKDRLSTKASDLYSVNLHYKRCSRALRAFRLTLERLTGSESSLTKTKSEPDELYYDLAEQVKILIQMNDEVYLRELPKTLNNPDDAPLKRYDAIQCALETLNEYLENTAADFRLRYQNNLPSEERVLWEEVDGVPPDPLFLKCFGPFFHDYLCKRPSERGPQLAVCANPDCLLVFRRRSKKDHTGKYCPTCRNKRREQRLAE